jgi:hypothetical protein
MVIVLGDNDGIVLKPITASETILLCLLVVEDPDDRTE